MKKIVVNSIVCALAIGLCAGLSWAGVDEAKLLGKWSGQVEVDFAGKKQSEKVKLEFKKKGVVIATDSDGKAEKAKYAIKGDKIVFYDPDDGKEEVHLTNISLTKKKLSGDFRPVDSGGMPPGIKIKLVLTRAK